MIIFRYLVREVLTTTAAVCAVLMLVVVSSRFIKYLADAAAGKLDPGVLFAIIGYRLPDFLELVIPLAFFLSILLAYGQLYVGSEMTVLRACGMSEKTLVGYTLVIAVVVSALVGWLSISVGPTGLAKAEEIFNAQKRRGEIEGLSPGRFYSLRGGRGVTYAETISQEGRMGNVFLAQADENGADNRGLVIVVAREGFSRQSETTGENYLVLQNGQRIQGIPGQPDFQITDFAEYGQRLEPVKPWELRAESEAMLTGQLLESDDPEHRAAVQWRFSLPVLVIVVALMAVPLSKTNPRQGRYVKILPAILLYVAYLLSLNAARGAVEEGRLPLWPGLWWVHGVFLLVALLLMAISTGWRPWRRRLPRAEPA